MNTSPEARLKATHLINNSLTARRRGRVTAPLRLSLMSVEELHQLNKGDSILLAWGTSLSRVDSIKSARITSIQTWKTRPSDIRIGWKYGLYEFGSIMTSTTQSGMVMIVKEDGDTE